MSEPVERPTLRQVAALAGVSLKTVSRVVNNEPHVSPETIAAVHAAATQLGFRVNALARELRAGAASSTVGLLVGDLANPYWSGVARGVERTISAHGLRLLSASTDENPDREWALAQDMLDRRVRALLVVTSSTTHDYLAAELRRNVAVTFLDRPSGDIEADTILLDNVGGARTAVQHLASRGSREIAVVGDMETLYTHRERLRGYQQQMAELGLTVRPNFIRSGATSALTAEAIVDDLLLASPSPTAIFTLNNWITAGAIRALWRLPEPARPALVGFDDIEFGDLLGVTVIAHDAEEMGRRGAEAAMARLGDADAEPTLTLIETRLVERGSGERSPN